MKAISAGLLQSASGSPGYTIHIPQLKVGINSHDAANYVAESEITEPGKY